MELKTVETKVITGISIRTDNATEMTPEQGKIGPLWQKFDELIPVNYQGGERVYGIYTNYESDHTGKFDVLAGFDGASTPDSVEVKKISIPDGKYLVFSHKGEMPQIAIDAWTEVWQYFTSDNAEYERLFSVDFEYYPYNNEIEVHIAVK